jgi:hypothetical protein
MKKREREKDGRKNIRNHEIGYRTAKNHRQTER